MVPGALGDFRWWPRVEPAEYETYAEACRERAALFRDLHLAADECMRALGDGMSAPATVFVCAAGVETTRAGLAESLAALSSGTAARLEDLAARAAADVHDLRAQASPGDEGLGFAIGLIDQRAEAHAEAVAEEAERRARLLGANHVVALAEAQGVTVTEPAGSGLTGAGMLAGAMGRDGVHRARSYRADASSALAGVAERLRELGEGVTGPARGWVRLAVASVTDEAGRARIVIGTNELDGYLRAGILLRDGESVAGNEEWPELSIAAHCAAHGLIGGPVVGAQPLPDDVAGYLRTQGFEPSSASVSWAPPEEVGDAAQDQQHA
ncbi:hypothetical protein P0W64_17185 [Tsukamurella sp. 8F]|uniref:hypothetical protein n=1 Tax=unclassified Tsukamurella TaxID=2633480 RepID=UPI0023B9F215|nr:MULTISPECIES: hypothetical protein [unclassified Tsukamurella]MDF0531250.1 hypothetical protein [Tsukamurella sp. 8J]MDF0588519.1 hypothetical protein [Tsukamurella sp. 8F]